ncbi:MAG: DinB family protein [Candidatus Halalkalibacterium sp. M3_1C_030]
MKSTKLLLLCLLVNIVSCTSNSNDSDPDSVTVQSLREQFKQNFNRASRILELAKTMPADKYSWRPEKEVMSVEEVYTHIAHYNYLYPATSLGIPAPKDIDMENIESITGKENVVAILEASIKHVKEVVAQMPDSKFSADTEMYGRTINGQAVLLQLLTHKSEHFGQSIAYARMNGVVPPWNR